MLLTVQRFQRLMYTHTHTHRCANVLQIAPERIVVFTWEWPCVGCTRYSVINWCTVCRLLATAQVTKQEIPFDQSRDDAVTPLMETVFTCTD